MKRITMANISVAGSESRRYHARTFESQANVLPELFFRAVAAAAPARTRSVARGCSDVEANPLSLARGGDPDILVQPGGRPPEATTARPPPGYAPTDRAG